MTTPILPQPIGGDAAGLRGRPRIGPGYAAQRLERFADKLARSEDPSDLVRAECIRVILAQRSKLLTEKFGPERDFSRPAPGSAP